MGKVKGSGHQALVMRCECDNGGGVISKLGPGKELRAESGMGCGRDMQVQAARGPTRRGGRFIRCLVGQDTVILWIAETLHDM